MMKQAATPSTTAPAAINNEPIIKNQKPHFSSVTPAGSHSPMIGTEGDSEYE